MLTIGKRAPINSRGTRDVYDFLGEYTIPGNPGRTRPACRSGGGTGLNTKQVSFKRNCISARSESPCRVIRNYNIIRVCARCTVFSCQRCRRDVDIGGVSIIVGSELWLNQGCFYFKTQNKLARYCHFNFLFFIFFFISSMQFIACAANPYTN